MKVELPTPIQLELFSELPNEPVSRPIPHANRKFLKIFKNELAAHKIHWCKGGCDHSSSHKRGFAVRADVKRFITTSSVHLDSKFATRAALHRGLHEIGHVVANSAGMRRWEEEARAEAWATKRMRELGITVPRKVLRRGKDYVERMKHWSRNIAAGRRLSKSR